MLLTHLKISFRILTFHNHKRFSQLVLACWLWFSSENGYRAPGAHRRLTSKCNKTSGHKEGIYQGLIIYLIMNFYSRNTQWLWGIHKYCLTSNMYFYTSSFFYFIYTCTLVLQTNISDLPPKSSTFSKPTKTTLGMADGPIELCFYNNENFQFQ